MYVNFAELAFEVKLGAEDLAEADYIEDSKNVFKSWGFVKDRLEELYCGEHEEHLTELRKFFVAEYEACYNAEVNNEL